MFLNGKRIGLFGKGGAGKRKGIILIGVIHQDPSISRSWLMGTPIKADEAMLEVQKNFDRLEDAGQS